MRSSLATFVPSRTGVQWPSSSVTIRVPLFFLCLCRTSSGHQIWQTCNVYRKEKQFCSRSFLFHKWIFVAKGKNVEITFNTVVIKLLHWYLRGWGGDNSLLAAVRTNSNSFDFFFFLCCYSFFCLWIIELFIENAHTCVSLPLWQPDVFSFFIFEPCFLTTVRRRARIELGKGESSHVSCDTSIGKSKQG